MIGTIGGYPLVLREIPRLRPSSQPPSEDGLNGDLVTCPHNVLLRDRKSSPDARMTRLDGRAFPHLLPSSGAIDMPGPLLTDALWGRSRPPAALKVRFHSTSVAAYL